MYTAAVEAAAVEAAEDDDDDLFENASARKARLAGLICEANGSKLAAAATRRRLAKRQLQTNGQASERTQGEPESCYKFRPIARPSARPSGEQTERCWPTSSLVSGGRPLQGRSLDSWRRPTELAS